MINDLLKYLTGTPNAVVLGIFKVLLVSVAMPILLFMIKSWHTEAVRRRDRRRDLYADALSVCMEYKEFPFVIYRRNGKEPEQERTRISEALRDVQKRLAHYRSWLMTESKDVAAKYDDLVAVVKSVAGKEMKKRWAEPPITRDADMTVVPKFDWTGVDEKEKAYVVAVRKQLAPFWKRPFIR